ncbi:MAG TPA: DUF4386 domain-containing protein [Actinomycetota bacterium]|nr:DUF4386 domain-containing protein [Actinomycetota bacterium]
MNPDRKTASLFGWLFIATFVLSIPAFFIFYGPVRDHPAYVTGAGADQHTIVGLGVVCEVLLIIANVGTAVVIFPILKRFSETGPIAYVSARLVEAMFIAIGIISILTILFLRDATPRITDPALGQLLNATYDRAFLVGPGFFAGVANGIILGTLMYRTGLVPRGMTWLGLIGGPLVVLSGIAIMLGLTERGGSLQGLATIPEFFWELSLGVYCVAKGFRASSIAARPQPAPAV